MAENFIKKILVITMLFPNSREATKAPFVLRIVSKLSKYAEIKVIAPVRWFPGTGLRKIKNIPTHEKIVDIDVYHPRGSVESRLLLSLSERNRGDAAANCEGCP